MAATGSSGSAAGPSRSHSTMSFNLYLAPYSDHTEDEGGDRTQVLQFRVESLKKLANREAKREAVSNVDLTVLPSLMPAPEELNFDQADLDANVVVWVGMRPSTTWVEGDQDADTGGGAPGNKSLFRPNTKGFSVTSLRSYTVIPHDPHALRVVCPVKGKTAIYYALTHQDPTTKLCTGVHVEVEEVCFFPEFRVDTVATLAERKTQWAAKVRERCEATSKPTSSRNYDKTKFIVGGKRSFANEIVSMGQMYLLTGEVGYMNTSTSLLESFVNDITNEKIEKNTALCKLVYGNMTPSQENCDEALQEIKDMWPRVGDRIATRPGCLKEIAHCLRCGSITLPYRIIRMFLVECHERLMNVGPAECHLDEDTAAGIAKGVVSKIEDMVGEGGPPKDDNTESTLFAAFLENEAMHLEKVADLFQVRLSALKDSQGDHTIAGTLPEIWERFGNNVDKDSAKNLAAHLHRFVVNATAELFTDLQGELREKSNTWKGLAQHMAEPMDDAADEGGE